MSWLGAPREKPVPGGAMPSAKPASTARSTRPTTLLMGATRPSTGAADRTGASSRTNSKRPTTEPRLVQATTAVVASTSPLVRATTTLVEATSPLAGGTESSVPGTSASVPSTGGLRQEPMTSSYRQGRPSREQSPRLLAWCVAGEDGGAPQACGDTGFPRSASQLAERSSLTKRTILLARTASSHQTSRGASLLLV